VRLQPGTVGGRSQPAAGRSGLSTDREIDRRSFADEMRYRPGCLAVPPLLHAQSTRALPLQTGPAERLLALHLHQRPSEAHHNLDVLPRALDPCGAAPLAASLSSASAVISIRQGCNKFEANLSQQETCTVCRVDINGRADSSGATQRAVLGLHVRCGTEGTILRFSAHCFQPVSL
jgi:hypothetical protein